VSARERVFSSHLLAGLGQTPAASSCCDSCAEGGPCSGCGKGEHNLPGQVSAMPVGFGQDSSSSGGNTAGASALTTTTSAISAWAVPLTVGAIAVAAGFGLAYAISSGRRS